MKRILSLAAVAIAMAVPAFSVTVVSNDKVVFNVGGRAQTYAYVGFSGDTNTSATTYDTSSNVVPNGAQKDSVRPFLGLKMARMYMNGSFEKWRYNMEMAFGPETSVDGKASGAFVFLDLMDAYIDIPLFGNSYLRAGQTKVPNGLEALAGDTSLPFVDYSLGYNAYQQGRDVSGLLAINEGVLSCAVGAFVGAGRNIPERYLPTKVGFPGVVARIGIDTGISKDVLAPVDYYSPIEKAAFAVHGTFLYEQDSRVGHGTMFSQKKADAPLLLTSGYNRFINTTWGYYGEYMQVGGDLQFKTPVGENILNIEAEGSYAVFTPTNFAKAGTNVTVAGGRVSATLSTKKVDLSLRYSILLPDQRFPNLGGVTNSSNNYIYYTGTTATTNVNDAAPMHEVTLSAKIRFTDFFRVCVDVPVYINMVRVYEAGNGPYIFADMPTSSMSYVGGANTKSYYERVLIPEIRAVAELQF